MILRTVNSSVFNSINSSVVSLEAIKRKELITGLPSKVSTIAPSNNSVNQQLDVVLIWTKPSQAQKYDVYFGTESGNLTLVSSEQFARTYVPSGLELTTTYYFRIDSINTEGTTTGDEFNFSTWDIDDIWTDQDGTPWTDQNGNYIIHERT